MSRELFKSITYKDNKVYTRQVSSNVTPRHFYSVENTRLSKIYNELGEKGFEKWFICNSLTNGTAEIVKDCNKVLKRLNYIYEELYKDEQFNELNNKLYVAEDNLFVAKNEKSRSKCKQKYESIKNERDNYISSFYNTYNAKYLIKERQGRDVL